MENGTPPKNETVPGPIPPRVVHRDPNVTDSERERRRSMMRAASERTAEHIAALREADRKARFKAARSAEANARIESQSISLVVRKALHEWATSGDKGLLLHTSERVTAEAKSKAARPIDD